MAVPKTVRSYHLSEIEALEPLEFILIAPMDRPLEVTEVTRNEDGALEVRIPGRPPIVPQLEADVRSRLAEMEFASEDPTDPVLPWARTVENPEAAIDLVKRVREQVFGEKPEVKLNLMHGSHRQEVEAKAKVALARTRIEPLLADILGRPAEQDDDKDYILPIGEVHVTVAPRVLPDGTVVIRVFAITNVAVQVTGELGLFLARLNFGMMFGRFALDTEHRSIWFDEILLGDRFREDELRFIVDMVASTADGWDDRLKQMFGGMTYQEAVSKRSTEKLPPIKPGEGGGMYL